MNKNTTQELRTIKPKKHSCKKRETPLLPQRRGLLLYLCLAPLGWIHLNSYASPAGAAADGPNRTATTTLKTTEALRHTERSKGDERNAVLISAEINTDVNRWATNAHVLGSLYIDSNKQTKCEFYKPESTLGSGYEMVEVIPRGGGRTIINMYSSLNNTGRAYVTTNCSIQEAGPWTIKFRVQPQVSRARLHGSYGLTSPGRYALKPEDKQILNGPYTHTITGVKSTTVKERTITLRYPEQITIRRTATVELLQIQWDSPRGGDAKIEVKCADECSELQVRRDSQVVAWGEVTTIRNNTAYTLTADKEKMKPGVYGQVISIVATIE